MSVIQGQADAAPYQGGGIFISNAASVKLANILLSISTGSTSGGGIFIGNSSLTLNNSTLSENTCGGTNGGGIDAVDSNITIIDSTVSNNYSRGKNGGGLSLTRTTASISGSTISGNSADGINVEGYGGGIYAIDTRLDIVNSTISGNSALVYGGGILAAEQSHVAIINSTVSDNSSATGGGILAYAIDNIANPPIVNIGNSIIAGNIASGGGDELAGIVAVFNTNNTNIFGHAAISDGAAFSFFLATFNLGYDDITATSNGTNPTTLNAILDPLLRDNGGPTKTHALLASSSAIDGADTRDCPREDQRNKTRDATGDFYPIIAPNGRFAVINLGGECDIGAVEFSPGD